jgi:Ran GTPase-activating protein (RanGAP) involved in mRNA processing and transport
MVLPEDYHSLVAEVYHPHVPPSQIAHISCSRATPFQLHEVLWTGSDATLLQLCKEVASKNESLRVFLSSYDDGSYVLLQNNEPRCSTGEHESPSMHSTASCMHGTNAFQWTPHNTAALNSPALQFERAVCCLSVNSAEHEEKCPAAKDIAAVLSQLPNLQDLELRSPSKRDIYRNPYAIQVQSTLGLCTGLRSLTIRGICGEDDCQAPSPLVPALLLLSSLQTLALTDNAITSQTLSDLQEHLADPATVFLPNLKSLNLSCNRLWYLGVYPLHSLLTRLTEIEEIDLSGSLLGIEIFGRYALSDAFRALKSLRTIRMNNNRLHGEVLKPLARAWGTLQNVKHVDLKNSCVRHTMDIAYSLSLFSGLQHLDLSGATQNDVSSWSLLSSALKPLNSLTHLSLQSCQLSSSAMSLLMPALTSASKLLTLDLSNNERVTSKGIVTLAKHLSCFPLLQTLVLSCFDASGEGGYALAHALEPLLHLNRLDLGEFCTCGQAAKQLHLAARCIADVESARIIDADTAQLYPGQRLKSPMLRMV